MRNPRGVLLAMGLMLGGCATVDPVACPERPRRVDNPTVQQRQAYDAADIAWASCELQNDNKFAALLMGEAYLNGRVIAVDYDRARKLLEDAAQDENPVRMEYQAPSEIGGQGKVVAVRTGENKLGYARAQFALGRIHDEGLGVRPDVAKAVKWYQRAAAQGHEGAQQALYRLGY